VQQPRSLVVVAIKLSNGSLFVNLYASREAEWPRYHADNSDDDFEEAIEAPEHEVPERSEV
jgi:hypothetical protein